MVASPVVEIRPAQTDDAARLSDLSRQLGYTAARNDVADRLARLADDPQSTCLVAVERGRVVGAVMFYFVPVVHQVGDWCRITALVVDENARGRGVGQALISAAEEAALATGCVRIEATSARRRKDAHRFYDRLGYARDTLHFVKILVRD